jgi:hypothetical protein
MIRALDYSKHSSNIVQESKSIRVRLVFCCPLAFYKKEMHLHKWTQIEDATRKDYGLFETLTHQRTHILNMHDISLLPAHQA